MMILNFSKFISFMVLFLCLLLGLNFNFDLIEVKFGYSLDNLPSWFSFFASTNFIWTLFIIILSSIIVDSFSIKSSVLSVFSNTLSTLLLTVVLLKVLDPSFIDILVNETKLFDNRVALWREVYNSEILKLYGSSRPDLLEKFNTFRESKSQEIITFLGQDFFIDMTLTQIKESAVKSAKVDLTEFLDHVRRLEAELKPDSNIPYGLIGGIVIIALLVTASSIIYSLNKELSETLISNANLEYLQGLIKYKHAVTHKRIDTLITDINEILKNNKTDINELYDLFNSAGTAIGGLKKAYIIAIEQIYAPLIIHSECMGKAIVYLGRSPEINRVAPDYALHAQRVAKTLAELSLDFPPFL